jgi:universal stress protein E
LAPEYLPLAAPGAGLGSLLGRQRKSLEGHREGLRALAARHGIAPAQVHLEAGDARELIPEVALRRRADLVVMGAVSRSRLRQLLVGSTAESVLDRLECDVLAVKPAAGAD